MRHLTPPPATEDQITRLEGLEGESVYLLFGDERESGGTCLTTCIIPGEPLFFGYSSAEHERAARPLLVRCAAVLGYEIEDG